MMFGYACDETDELMPLPIHLAHRMAERLAEVRQAGTVPYLRPDGKTQVTFDYEDGKPVRLRTVLISTQHNDGIDRDEVIRPDLIEHVIRPVVPEQFADDDYEVFVNPTGRFVIGGPVGDAGLTGRKIIVDTYGGMGRHGGGAFSGKDPSKVDRSAAYAARWVAKNVVAAGAADALRGPGRLRHRRGPPVSIMVETFGTETVDDDQDRRGRPRGLRPPPGRHPPRPRPAPARSTARPRPTATSAAADPDFTWEQTDKVDDAEVGARALSDGSATARPRVVRVLPDRPGHRQDASTTSVPRAAGPGARRDRGARSSCTAAGSAAGSWPTTSSPRPGVEPQAARQGHERRAVARADRPGRLGGLAVGRRPAHFLRTASPDAQRAQLRGPASASTGCIGRRRAQPGRRGLGARPASAAPGRRSVPSWRGRAAPWSLWCLRSSTRQHLGLRLRRAGVPRRSCPTTGPRCAPAR